MDKQDWEKVLNIVGQVLGVVAVVALGWGLVLVYRMGGLGHLLAWDVPAVVLGMAAFYGLARWYGPRQAYVSPKMEAILDALPEAGEATDG